MTIARASLDPAVLAFLEFLESEGRPHIEQLPVNDARALFAALQSLPVEKPPADSEDISIPAGPKGQISLRIVRPKGNSDPLPAVVYFHGGGWVLGDKDSFDFIVRQLAVGSESAVVFVDYSRAPESPFPTAVEEAFAALQYVSENSGALRLDPERLAVAGDSAGGNLAAVTAILSQQRGGPRIACQVLFYPPTDLLSETPSVRENAEGYFLTLNAMKWFGQQYLRNGDALSDPTASPLRTPVEQLKGLPPALIVTAEFDPLRDQGEEYAHKLAAEGVSVTCARYIGTIHGFNVINALAHTPAARAANTQACEFLRRAFAHRGEKTLSAR